MKNPIDTGMYCDVIDSGYEDPHDQYCEVIHLDTDTQSSKMIRRNSCSRTRLLLAIAVAVFSILSIVFMVMYFTSKTKEKPGDCQNCNIEKFSKNCTMKKSQNTSSEKEREYLDLIKQIYFSSCSDAHQKIRNAENSVYRIKDNTSSIGYSKTYCQMTSLPGCHGGGWTLAMKINGRNETFRYNSSYWSNKQSYNPAGGLSGLDDQETKLPTYWNIPFNELCVGMKVGHQLQFVYTRYSATSLYSVIADGQYRETHIGRIKWLSLANASGALLQPNCNLEGFNAFKMVNPLDKTQYFRARLGILANDENNCATPDSYLGFGGVQSSPGICGSGKIVNTCGNRVYCEPGKRNMDIIAMGYIFVR